MALVDTQGHSGMEPQKWSDGAHLGWLAARLKLSLSLKRYPSPFKR